MTDDPSWLAQALGAPPPRATLSAARLAGADLLGCGGFELTSPAFDHGGELDPSFTAHEEDAVAPPLEWTAPPTEAVELALIVEDADDPADAAPCHWLVWGLRAQRGKLLEGEIPPRAGKNAQGNSEWLLPRLRPDDAPRRYVFQLFASDVGIGLMPGASRDDLLRALDGHVVGVAILSGRFAYPEEESDWDSEDEA